MTASRSIRPPRLTWRSCSTSAVGLVHGHDLPLSLSGAQTSSASTSHVVAGSEFNAAFLAAPAPAFS